MHNVRAQKGFYALALFTIFGVLIHLHTQVFRWYHWPLSNYTMFAWAYRLEDAGTIAYFSEFENKRERLLPHNTDVGLLLYQLDVTPELWERFKRSDLTPKERLFLYRASSLDEMLTEMKTPRTGRKLIVEFWEFHRLSDGKIETVVKDSICLKAEDVRPCENN